jgi:hypothetical protein
MIVGGSASNAVPAASAPMAGTSTRARPNWSEARRRNSRLAIVQPDINGKNHARCPASGGRGHRMKHRPRCVPPWMMSAIEAGNRVAAPRTTERRGQGRQPGGVPERHREPDHHRAQHGTTIEIERDAADRRQAQARGRPVATPTDEAT